MTSAPEPISRRPDNIYLFWLVLALPGIFLVLHGLMFRGGVDYLRWSGEVSCILLIAAMLVTPLQMIMGPLPWLRKRRRHFGVASAIYASLHLAIWLAEANIGKLLRSFGRPDVLAGWIALALLLLLAAISQDRMVRLMGPRWKQVQRWVYPAAILTLIHWAMLTDFAPRVAVYALPLLLLSAWRLMRHLQGR
jgi:sulfoxide reductase heme-binding subunit YedZ